MKYVASVIDKETKKLMIIESEYETKKSFMSDLRSNGYSVRFISTPEKFDEDVEKYHEKLRINREIQNAIYNSDKKIAEKLGMSVRDYRNFILC